MAAKKPKTELQVLDEGEGHSIDLGVNGHTVTVRLHGRISEDASFAGVLSVIERAMTEGAKEVCIDLKDVTQINSCGVREWLMFIEKLQLFAPLCFTRVSEAFIEQASILPTVLGKTGTPVDSFEGPYFCRNCNERVIHDLRVEDVMASGAGLRAPSFQCQKCGKALEFDAPEEEFLSFVAHLIPGSKSTRP